MTVKLDAKGLNAAIGSNLLPEVKMRELGFTDHSGSNWYFVQRVADDITFNLTIPKDGGRLSIEVLDEDFGQHYDYQAILKRSPKLQYALNVKGGVELLMGRFVAQGVLTGWKKGMYI